MVRMTIAECDRLLERRTQAYHAAVDSLDGEAMDDAMRLLNEALDLRLTLPQQVGPLDRLMGRP